MVKDFLKNELNELLTANEFPEHILNKNYLTKFVKDYNLGRHNKWYKVYQIYSFLNGLNIDVIMSKINILIISHEPLTPTLKKLYCISELKKKFNIEFLSLRSFFYKSNEFCFEDELKDEFKEFSNLFDFRKYMSLFNKKSTYIFLENSAHHISSLLINFILRDYKICRFILYKSFVNYSPEISKTSLLKKVSTYSNFRNTIKLLIRKLDFKKFHIVFGAGKFKSDLSTDKYIPLNSTVYEKNIKPFLNKRYCVFIDQGYPSHPDLIKNGYVNEDEIKFIEMYNRFFDYIEKTYNIEVIIAKHPKSRIPDSFFKKENHT